MASILLWSGCGPRNEFVPPPPPKVTVAEPVEQPVVETVEFNGNTRAVSTVELRSRVNGYLEKIAFEDGAIVQQGDLLFIIEQAPFQAELEAAKAARAHAALQRQKRNQALESEPPLQR